jgi:hypothetical protein
MELCRLHGKAKRQTQLRQPEEDKKPAAPYFGMEEE